MNNNQEFQQKMMKIQNIYNDILQCLSSNNIQLAKDKSWLLHEVISTQFGANYENNKS